MKKLILFQAIFLFSIIEIKAQTTETVTINMQGIDTTDSLIKPHMLGVIAGPAANGGNNSVPDLTTRYQDIGVTSVRNNDYRDDRLDMERMFFCGTYPIDTTTPNYPKWDCSPDSTQYYHFTESDAQFKNWIDGGFLPFFRLGGEHGTTPRRHDYEGPRSTEETNWIQAGLKVVDRYNSFGGDTNTLKGYLDIWTEYPHHNFWDRDSIKFNNFWCNTFDSLKTHFPSLKIGGPGFNTSVSTILGNTGTVKTWINLFLLELKARNLKPDWIGFHVFSNDIQDFYNAALNYRKLLRAEPPFDFYTSVWGSGNNSFFNGTELICDAWGFENDELLPQSTRDSLFNKQRGAAHHVGVFIALQQAYIERAYKYRGGEEGTDTTQSISGLFYGNANAVYKPTAYGFKLCSKMQTIYNKKLISPVYAVTSGGSKIWTLAGEDSTGNKAMLISNPTAKTINLSLTLNGSSLSTSLFPYINHYKVTDTNDGQTPSAWTNGAFVLPPYTSHLITMRNNITDIEKPIILPASITLLQNYPNPFNPTTTIRFSLPQREYATLKVFNVLGKEVAVLVNEKKEPGTYSVNFSGSNLASGTYFYRLQAGAFVQTKKFVLLK